MAGVRAARANFLPALVVQAAMVGLLVAYYQYEPTTELLNRLASVKQRLGYTFTVVSAIVAAALMPEALRILFFQKGQLQARNLGNILFAAPFWAVMSITVDYFYQLQGRIFGPQVDIPTVAIKVVIDQFVYTAFFATPVTCVLYDWKRFGYRFGKVLEIIDRGYYRRVVFPVVITNWAVWIPLISVVYSLPGPLQIPLFSLALCMWVLLFTWMNERQK
jgi:hypothetical protein